LAVVICSTARENLTNVTDHIIKKMPSLFYLFYFC